MRKIPTVFERDWDGDRSRVLNVPHPGCEWVFAGEGVATRKYDGQAALIRDGVLYRRHEVKADKKTGKLRDTPPGFELVETDPETGNMVGWVPVTTSPSDQWFIDAFDASHGWKDGTYELVGPKVQGNPEGYDDHRLVKHEYAVQYQHVDRTFAGLEAFFHEHAIEGLVFHHPDGRMAKIKARDFGLRRE